MKVECSVNFVSYVQAFQKLGTIEMCLQKISQRCQSFSNVECQSNLMLLHKYQHMKTSILSISNMKRKRYSKKNVKNFRKYYYPFSALN